MLPMFIAMYLYAFRGMGPRARTPRDRSASESPQSKGAYVEHGGKRVYLSLELTAES